jgi:hypothetical protein
MPFMQDNDKKCNRFSYSMMINADLHQVAVLTIRCKFFCQSLSADLAGAFPFEAGADGPTFICRKDFYDGYQ